MEKKHTVNMRKRQPLTSARDMDANLDMFSSLTEAFSPIYTLGVLFISDPRTSIVCFVGGFFFPAFRLNANYKLHTLCSSSAQPLMSLEFLYICDVENKFCIQINSIPLKIYGP